MVSKKRNRRKIGFNQLAGKVTREYERRGYSHKRAQEIGKATAGQVARAKRRH